MTWFLRTASRISQQSQCHISSSPRSIQPTIIVDHHRGRCGPLLSCKKKRACTVLWRARQTCWLCISTKSNPLPGASCLTLYGPATRGKYENGRLPQRAGRGGGQTPPPPPSASYGLLGVSGSANAGLLAGLLVSGPVHRMGAGTIGADGRAGAVMEGTEGGGGGAGMTTHTSPATFCCVSRRLLQGSERALSYGNRDPIYKSNLGIFAPWELRMKSLVFRAVAGAWCVRTHGLDWYAPVAHPYRGRGTAPPTRTFM